MSDTVADDAKVLTALLAAYGPVECERLSRRATRWRLGALPTSGDGCERLRELCEQHEALLEELAEIEVAGMCSDAPASARHSELVKLTGADQLDLCGLLLQALPLEKREQAPVLSGWGTRPKSIDADPKPRG